MPISKSCAEYLCPQTPKIEWAGKWIWVSQSEAYSTRNSYVLFRGRFNAGGSLTINIAADTRYDLFIDNIRISRGTAPSVINYKVFDTYKVDLLDAEHIIAVMVHHLGEECATASLSHPGLIVEILSGDIPINGSDSSWKATACKGYKQDLPQMMSHFGFYEVCDYRSIPHDWTGISFDDSKWSSAEVVGEAGCKPWKYLIPRDIPQLETTTFHLDKTIANGDYTESPDSQELILPADAMANRTRNNVSYTKHYFPISLGSSKNEFIAVDFGREVTGHVRLKFSGAHDGQQIDIGYDEKVDDNGLPNPRRTAVSFADRYYLYENQKYLEVFNARGFRYLLIDIPASNGGINLTGVEIDERRYQVNAKSSFSCSDCNLEEFFQVGLETTRMCMLDTYVDCPSRERVMWMDSYIEGLCSSYGMGITELWRRTLYMFAQDTSKLEDLAGAVKGFAPTDREPIVQTYMMFYVCSVADYVLHSGDMKTAEVLFNSIMDQFAVLSKFTTDDGLINDKWPNWQFIDWSAMDYGGVSGSVNAIYLAMHRKAARLARQIGKNDTADDLESGLEALKEVYIKTFWNADDKLFIDALYEGVDSGVRSQLTNALAIWAGVIDGDDARNLIRHITAKEYLLPVTTGDYRGKPEFKVQTGGIVPVGTPALATFLPLIMFDLNMDKEAYAYMQEIWKPAVSTATFVEHICEDTNTSFCHGWSAAPVVFLMQYTLGIKPLNPGWTNVEIAPHPGSLQWAKGSVITPLGNVDIEWKVTDGGIDLHIHAPEGMDIIRG